ncbi:MAG: hypothetical protein D6762_01610 [Candidatus Neomarinimicrobiota bacterium]|nr:MAG: hypothetical protein D6762_01610 [Candidatus Neomarinimicrobiota bacterium]
MFTHLFERIDGIHIYPITAMVFFLVAFGLVILGAWSLKQKETEYIRHLPLESAGGKEGKEE